MKLWACLLTIGALVDAAETVENIENALQNFQREPRALNLDPLPSNALPKNVSPPNPTPPSLPRAAQLSSGAPLRPTRMFGGTPPGPSPMATTGRSARATTGEGESEGEFVPAVAAAIAYARAAPAAVILRSQAEANASPSPFGTSPQSRLGTASPFGLSPTIGASPPARLSPTEPSKGDETNAELKAFLRDMYGGNYDGVFSGSRTPPQIMAPTPRGTGAAGQAAVALPTPTRAMATQAGAMATQANPPVAMPWGGETPPMATASPVANPEEMLANLRREMSALYKPLSGAVPTKVGTAPVLGMQLNAGKPQFANVPGFIPPPPPSLGRQLTSPWNYAMTNAAFARQGLPALGLGLPPPSTFPFPRRLSARAERLRGMTSTQALSPSSSKTPLISQSLTSRSLVSQSPTSPADVEPPLGEDEEGPVATLALIKELESILVLKQENNARVRAAFKRFLTTAKTSRDDNERDLAQAMRTGVTDKVVLPRGSLDAVRAYLALKDADERRPGPRVDFEDPQIKKELWTFLTENGLYRPKEQELGRILFEVIRTKVAAHLDDRA